MEKIRVLHLYKKSILESYGGVEKFIDTLCKSTYEFDIDNILFSLSKRNLNQQISLDKYIIINAKQDIYIFSTGFSIQAFSKFKKLASSVDIIHYHFPNPFADILHFFCGIKKPFLITYHSDIVKQKLIFFIYRYLINICTYIIIYISTFKYLWEYIFTFINIVLVIFHIYLSINSFEYLYIWKYI